MNSELFEKLVTTPGVSGREERIREVVRDEIADLVDDVRVDRLGNIVGTKAGAAPRVMLAAHMDSIGFLVKHIDDNGFLRLSPVGGFDPRVLNAQRVKVCGKKDYIGLLSATGKPIHILDPEERKRAPKIEDLFVDLMAAPEDIKEDVQIGDPVVLVRTPLITDRAVTAPYLDDRLGVYILIEAVRRARDAEVEIHAVVTVQEEVGLRGARTGAYAAEPDIGVALDVTIAADVPGTGPEQQVSKLGGGVAISVMDSSSISDPRLVARFKEVADKHSIPHQMEVLSGGGTDAGAMQLVRDGTSVITISTPVRYVHTVNEMASVQDVEATIDLVAHFLEGAHELDLGR